MFRLIISRLRAAFFMEKFMNTPTDPEWVVLAKYFFAPLLAAIPGMLSRILAAKIVENNPLTIREVMYRSSTVAVFGLIGGGVSLYFDLHYLIGCTIAALFGNCGGSCLKLWREFLKRVLAGAK
jgi:hypothetical protein